MGWKNWPAWLKGGVIGLIYSVYSLIIFYSLQYIGNNLIKIILSITLLPFYSVGALFELPMSFVLALTGGSSLMFYTFDSILIILICIIIGWIVGRVKKK